MNVLVLCTGNSCRSQMMHGYLNNFAPKDWTIYSAGVEVHGLNKKAMAVLLEDGIDISTHTSNHVDEYANIDFNYIITVCDHAKESCPVFRSSAIQLHHNFSDPSKAIGTEDEIKQKFIETRNSIALYAELFVAIATQIRE